jgi:hypothetical protein
VAGRPEVDLRDHLLDVLDTAQNAIFGNIGYQFNKGSISTPANGNPDTLLQDRIRSGSATIA